MKTRGTKIVIVFAICIAMIVTNMLIFADEKPPGPEPTTPVAENLIDGDEITALGAEASLPDSGSTGRANANTDNESLENVAKPMVAGSPVYLNASNTVWYTYDPDTKYIVVDGAGKIDATIWSNKLRKEGFLFADKLEFINPATQLPDDCSSFFASSKFALPGAYSENSLTEIKLSNGISMTNVTNMSRMFAGSQGLTSLDLSPLTTANVMSMESMFAGCYSLTSLDLSPLNTANVRNMGRMFTGCYSLTSLDLSPLNTANVTNMEYMFSGCSGLRSLDLSPLNTANVRNMGSMFHSCAGLTSLDISSFNTANVTNMYGMFYGCSSLINLDIGSLNTANVRDMEAMFYGCSKLSSLDLSPFNTANVTNMRIMFSGCDSLRSLDIGSFNTANVRNMETMFKGCRGLTSLDISSFNTVNVTDMEAMFKGCRGLTSLDISSFNTANVMSMEDMFAGCTGLNSLDLSPLNTDKVVYMGDMLRNVSNPALTKLDLSNFASYKNLSKNTSTKVSVLSFVPNINTLIIKVIDDETKGRLWTSDTEKDGCFNLKPSKRWNVYELDSTTKARMKKVATLETDATGKMLDGNNIDTTPETSGYAGTGLEVGKVYEFSKQRKISFSAGSEGTITGKTDYYIDADGKVSLNDILGADGISTGKKLGDEVNSKLTPTMGHKFIHWAKDGTRTAALTDELIDLAADLELIAIYEKLDDVLLVDPNNPSVKPNGYVEVSIDTTDKGTLATGDRAKYYVNSTIEVTIPANPAVGNTGYRFKEWDKPLTGKFTDNTTITATYKTEDDVIPVVPADLNNPTIVPTKPAGYVVVTIEPGTKGKLPADQPTAYYVNPTVAVQIPVKDAIGNNGYVFKNWDNPLHFTFGVDTKITANYSIVETNNPTPASPEAPAKAGEVTEKPLTAKAGEVTAKPLTVKTGDETSSMITIAMIMSLMALGFMIINRRRQDN